MLRECIRHEPLAKIILFSNQFQDFFKYVELSTFDIASDAFATFKVIPCPPPANPCQNQQGYLVSVPKSLGSKRQFNFKNQKIVFLRPEHSQPCMIWIVREFSKQNTIY